MKVALVHSYYSKRQPSGENVVVDAQAKALRDGGLDVTIVGVSTDDLESQPGYKVRTAVNIATGRGLSPIEDLNRIAPDIVHVHNLFPNWGTSWLGQWQGPLLATVHNFRPVCAAGTLFRDGKVCTLCPDGGPLGALKHACYRDSKLASLPLTIRNRHGVSGDRLLSRADSVVLLSPRAERLYSSFGLPSDKTVVIPNFVADVGFKPHVAPGTGWVYIGRLTEEKGILNLLKHWPEDESLSIYGDGPLRRQVENSVSSNVRYMGHLQREEIPRVLEKSRGLVFPSEWAEGLPLVYAEALASGRPVVAKSGNSAADDVSVAGVGQVFDEWPEVGAALRKVEMHQATLGGRARNHFERSFSRSVWFEKTLDLYQSLLKSG
jgi:glycosyltransferase involved in cell wall biosynthesis